MTGQEIRLGYKLTEVGTIPEDWAVKSIAQVVDRVRLGGNYPNSSRPSTKPLIKMGNMGRGDIKTQTIEYVLEHFPVHEEHRLAVGDVLFNTRNTLDLVGKICIWRNELPVAYYNSNILRLEFSNSEIGSSYFANYALNSTGTVGRIRELATGTTSVAAIYTRDLLKLKFAVPPIPEQRAIATALSDADALIAALEGMIAKKRDLKQAAMQQLLTGKTRLPGFSGEWQVKRLGEIGEISGAGVDKKIVEREQPIRLLNYTDAYHRTFVTNGDLEHWVTAPSHKIVRCSVQKGDVFFTPSSETRDDIAHCVVASEDIPDAVYSYHVTRLRITEDWDYRFPAYAFQTREFLNQAQTVCDGSGTRYVISLSKFRDLTVRFPERSEQAAIAEVLSDMDTDIAALEARATKARMVKRGMMQELLTGRVRLV